jgi:nucleoside-diphosphate-sugar epimerase
MPFLGRRDGYVSLVTQDDAARAVVAAVKAPAGIYNVVDDEPMTRQALGDAIAKLLGVKPPKFMPPWVAKLGGSLGETLARSLRISNGKLKEATGWQPTVRSARDGFRLVLAARHEPTRTTGHGNA